MMMAHRTRPLILICDDEAPLRELVRAALGEAYDVVEAADATEAAEAVMRQRPEAVVLDLMLPGKSGIEFLAELRSMGEAMPVVIVSAWHTREQVAAALEAGADAFLGKPFDPDELAAVVKRLVHA